MLFRTKGHVPTRYSPVRRSLAGARLACVRPAASVRSEPGSNSQVESTEVLSLTSNLRTSVSSPSQGQDQSLLHVPSRSLEQRDPQVVKLTLTSSVGNLAAAPLVSRYARRLTPMRPNRPHIPSLHQLFKEPSSDKKRAIRQFLGVSLRALPSDFPDFRFVLPSLPSVTVTFPLR